MIKQLIKVLAESKLGLTTLCLLGDQNAIQIIIIIIIIIIQIIIINDDDNNDDDDNSLIIKALFKLQIK